MPLNILTITQQINQLRRNRFDLAAQLRAHDLAARDPVAVVAYEQITEIDSEIFGLRQVKDDLLNAGWLAIQGAAAVEVAEEILCSDIPY